MPQFIHASMYGSYYCECEVVGLTKDLDVIVSYTDPFTEERDVKTVKPSHMKYETRTPGSIGKA